MSTQGVIIRRGTTGAGVITGRDGISALIMHGVAVADKIALGEPKELRQLKDAEALGITSAYDTANDVRVWYHIKEFYRVLKLFGVTGTPLYIMLVDNTVSVGFESNVTMEMMVEDADAEYAKKLINFAKGEIRLLGVALNPAATYAATLLDGLDEQVIAAIPKAQGLADWAIEGHKPLSVILEGREFNGLAAAAQNLRDIDGLEAGDVLVTIAQDWDYAETLDALGKKHAAVGTVLGAAAAIRVNQNIGEVETRNIQEVTKDAFVTPGISSHEKFSEVEADRDTLDAKGYVYVLTYDGYDGAYFNDDHTCTPIIEDADGKINVHNLNLSRTVGKAQRALRNALLPKVKSVQLIDSTTGKLTPGGVKSFEAIGNQEFLRMQKAGEITNGKTYVDPDSDLLTPPRRLSVDFSVSPTTTVGEISGNINLTRTI